MSIDFKNITVNIVFVFILSAFLVSVTVGALSAFNKLAEGIKENRSHTDRQITEVVSALKVISASVERVAARTGDRWTRKDQELYCARQALLNPGWRCPAPNGPMPQYFVTTPDDNWQRSTFTKKAGRLN